MTFREENVKLIPELYLKLCKTAVILNFLWKYDVSVKCVCTNRVVEI